MGVTSGIFGVGVAIFLVAFCPNTLSIRHHSRQMRALPVCPPDNGKIILFPKPENCSEFYQCAGGVAFTQHCPENLYYCSEKQYCSWTSDPDCTFDCTVVKTKPVHIAQRPVPAADPVCPPQTDGNVTLIANPNNCSEYFECDNGVPRPMGCPDDLRFCSAKGICSWDWDPDCTFDCTVVKTKRVAFKKRPVPAADPVCPPQTDGNATLIANPNNCSEYFECDNGVPRPMGCPDDLRFCSAKGTCSWSWDPDCTFDCTVVKTKPVAFKKRPVPAADPVCPPQTDGNAILIANPNNCSEYFECDNGVPRPMGCPDDLRFCSAKGTCSWSWDPDCTFDCTVVKTKPVAFKNRFVPSAVPDCPTQTGGDSTYLPNTEDCSTFYECSNGKAILQECPENLYYCSELETCAYDWNLRCSFNCTTVRK